MTAAEAAVFLLVAILAGAALWRGYFWLGLILVAVLCGMGLLL